MLRLVKLAWRDIWRNRRRTFLTMGAILFAVVIISLANSVQFGTYDAMEKIIVRLATSDLQVQHRQFNEERMLEYSLAESSLNKDTLLAQYPWINAATRRLTGFGLVSSDSASTGALIVGVDPDTEPAVSKMVRVEPGGVDLASDDHRGVLLGTLLAKNLGLLTGDSVVVLTQGYHNVMGAEVYAVQGLVRTGTPQVDRTMMIMTLPAAQELFSMPGRYTELVLRTDQHGRAQAHAALIQESLQETDYAALPWQALMPDLDQMRRLDDASNYIFYAFLLLLIGFEVFNTTAMSMMERVREFGVMMAMGLKPGQVSGLVAMELVMKVFLGIAAGCLLSAVAIYFLADEPIALSQSMQDTYEQVGFVVDGIYFSRKLSVYVFPVVAVALLSAFSLLFPVFKMRRFSPVKALRAI